MDEQRPNLTGFQPATQPKAAIELQQVRNRQRPEPALDDVPGADLDVVDIFDTIQGEGPFAGRRAIFVRLAGCNIRCFGCDTEYTTGRRKLSAEQVLLEINQLVCAGWKNTPFAEDSKLVVITGGEPFRQPAVLDLIKLLDATLFRVQVETNGTIAPPLLVETCKAMRHSLWLVVSPKRNYLAPGLKLSEYVNGRIAVFKYVVEYGQVDPTDGLPTSVLGMPIVPVRPPHGYYGKVYVQPMEDVDPGRTARNTEQAVASCRRFGYVLCLQQHKLVGLP